MVGAIEVKYKYHNIDQVITRRKVPYLRVHFKPLLSQIRNKVCAEVATH